MAEIRWLEWEQNGGVVRMGTAPMKEIQSWITDRSKAVAELVRQGRIKCEHLVYAAKYYGDDGNIKEVRFYNQPMTDAEYEAVAGMKNCIVYAAHRR